MLSDPEKKEIYDQYGEEGLRADSAGGGSSRFSARDAEDIFAQFFGGGMGGGSGNPFRGRHGRRFRGHARRVRSPVRRDARGFRRARARTRRARAAGGARAQKADPIEQVLRLTLEEMYYGVQKNLKLTRTVIRGGAEQRVSETLTIDVKPGWKKGDESRSRRRATRRRA